jgi:RNA polymerase sigma factor (sigma-70 family)
MSGQWPGLLKFRRSRPLKLFSTNLQPFAPLDHLIGMTSAFQRDLPSQLICRAQSGERAAQESLYRQFESPVYTLALRVLANPDAARDVLQDTMLQAFTQLASLREVSSVGFWLRRLTLNFALARLRSRERERALSEVEAHELVAEDDLPNADHIAFSQALTQLPGLTRTVLWLYYVEGFTHAEIADQLGQSVSFSKSQLMRGGARLRTLLNTKENACLQTALMPS